ncbi:Rieske (2Fe-2S) protein [Nocardioides perillae]|uniref:Cytochrome bc1 complex Rieske iron-sulfur subunit n=1 Tax=Nocardioides perillae TaxID=1119534 RepID=A0A7Y9RUX3_9ACTN|nr:Rieske (2Fe-2S) protein [Nocardioides perillae]NYG55774.1 Rieske Fe-S protein [Nocardioides perillae]
MTHDDRPAPRAACLSRRHALGGAALAGLGVPVLAACAGDGGATSAGSGAGSGSGSGSGGSGSGMTGALTSTADVPEGSGVIFADQGVVVTQPTAGEFKAFSTTCTHQGCDVTDVTDTIVCPCHSSTFALADGAPLGGPATDPLEEIAITVEGDQIVLG